jgi:drug/metabolite transporter (DMT)-like permease
MLSTDKKDYSDYIKHLSNLIGHLSLFSGFMFTAYTILITRLPDPSGIIAQLTLYILSLFLNIFLFLISQFNVMVITSCRNVPPLTKRTAMTNSLFSISIFVAMFIVTSLMSLLWNLIYLALVQTVQWILFAEAIRRFILKPFVQYRYSVS